MAVLFEPFVVLVQRVDGSRSLLMAGRIVWAVIEVQPELSRTIKRVYDTTCHEHDWRISFSRENFIDAG